MDVEAVLLCRDVRYYIRGVQYVRRTTATSSTFRGNRTPTDCYIAHYTFSNKCSVLFVSNRGLQEWWPSNAACRPEASFLMQTQADEEMSPFGCLGHIYCGSCLEGLIRAGEERGSSPCCPCCRGNFDPNDSCIWKLYPEYGDDEPNVELTQERDRLQESLTTLEGRHLAQKKRIEELIGSCGRLKDSNRHLLARDKAWEDQIRERETRLRSMEDQQRRDRDRAAEQIVSITASRDIALKERKDMEDRLETQKRKFSELEQMVRVRSGLTGPCSEYHFLCSTWPFAIYRRLQDAGSVVRYTLNNVHPLKVGADPRLRRTLLGTRLMILSSSKTMATTAMLKKSLRRSGGYDCEEGTTFCTSLCPPEFIFMVYMLDFLVCEFQPPFLFPSQSPPLL